VENKELLDKWELLSLHERKYHQDGSYRILTISAVHAFCDIMDLTEEQFDRLLMIEHEKFPVMRSIQRQEKEQENAT